MTAQLIRGSDGFHEWSDSYDGAIDDVITIQEIIAIEISNALETALDPEALAQMVSVGTKSVAAYQAFLEGLAYGSRMEATVRASAFVAGRFLVHTIAGKSHAIGFYRTDTNRNIGTLR